MTNLFYLLQTSTLFFLITIGALGAMIGSFLNVVIYRLPLMLEHEWHTQCREFLTTTIPNISTTQTVTNTFAEKTNSITKFNLMIPRSHCPNCQILIRVWQNIPLLSYLLLGGKCKHCHTNIPLRYPLVELTSITFTVVVSWYFGFSWEMFAALILTWSLLCLSVIDIKHQLLPDNITLPLLWLGLLLSLFGIFCTPQDAVIGATVGYGSLWIVANCFKFITSKEGMGHGDFKLFALLGAWLGWQTLPFIILCSSILGIIISFPLLYFQKKKHSTPIPFGPFLAAAGWIALLWQQDIINLYFNYIGL